MDWSLMQLMPAVIRSVSKWDVTTNNYNHYSNTRCCMRSHHARLERITHPIQTTRPHCCAFTASTSTHVDPHLPYYPPLDLLVENLAQINLDLLICSLCDLSHLAVIHEGQQHHQPLHCRSCQVSRLESSLTASVPLQHIQANVWGVSRPNKKTRDIMMYLLSAAECIKYDTTQGGQMMMCWSEPSLDASVAGMQLACAACE